MTIDLTSVKSVATTFVSVNKWTILIIVVFIGLFLYIGFRYGSYHPDPNNVTVQNMLTKKITDAKTIAEQTIKDKDTQIKTLQDKLNQSYTKNSTYIKQILDLNTQVKNIKSPKNNKETRDRLKAVGYETK